MAGPAAAHDAPPIRLAILDDNPFVRVGDGSVVPVAATFHRFAEAVVAAGPFDRAAYLAPVRGLTLGEKAPDHRPVDAARLRVVATAPFDGIADYVTGAPRLVRRNWPIVRDEIARAHLTWMKVPASNALLVGFACRRSGCPRFAWVAGSVRAVVRGQTMGPGRRALATATAIGYDATTRWLERTGPVVRLDADLFTNIVTRAEVEVTRTQRAGRAARRADAPLRIAWAGRVAAEKGLDDLLAAVVLVRAAGRSVRLDLIGDGPARPGVEDLVRRLGLVDEVRWHGYVADREAFLDLLREADLFVLPSHAEGLPKVVVEAMSAGLPVVATNVGAVPALLRDGALGRLVPPDDPRALAAAIAALVDAPGALDRLAAAGLVWAADHTMESQADRLVAWMRHAFPALPWPDGRGDRTIASGEPDDATSGRIGGQARAGG